MIQFKIGLVSEGYCRLRRGYQVEAVIPGSLQQQGRRKAGSRTVSGGHCRLRQGHRVEAGIPGTYSNRGLEKLHLGLIDEAQRDLETTIKLAEKTNDENLVDKARRALDSLDGTDA